MNNNIFNKNLDYLKLDKEIAIILNNNNIITIKDLWNQNRNYLRKIGLLNNQIKDIIIKLELNGIDLNKKTYK